jgi:hypothetical protein
LYSIAKHVYIANGEVDTIGFAIDKENKKSTIIIKSVKIIIKEDVFILLSFNSIEWMYIPLNN